MKRILIIGMSDIMGGTEMFIMNYYRHMDKSKFQFDFLTNKERISFEDEITSLGGEVYRIPSPKNGYKKYKDSTDEFFKKNSNRYFAVWMNTSILINLDYLKYAKKYGISNRIIHSHTTKNPNGKMHGIIHRFQKCKLKKYATDYWACSDDAGRWFYSKKMMNGTHYKVVKNAIDIDAYRYNYVTRQKYRNELGIQDNFVVGNVGRLHSSKNQLFLLEIFNLLIKERKDAVLLMIGEGEDEDKIRNRIEELGIEDKVMMLGLRKDIAELLQAMDVFVFPSNYEGLGIALLEAQASGLICFASDKVIPQEVKVTKELTFLQLGNPHVWSNAIVQNSYNNDREKMYESVKKSPYEIGVAAIELQENFILMEKTYEN